MLTALRSRLWQHWAAWRWRTFHFSEVVYHLRDMQATNRVLLRYIGEPEA